MSPPPRVPEQEVRDDKSPLGWYPESPGCTECDKGPLSIRADCRGHCCGDRSLKYDGWPPQNTVAVRVCRRSHRRHRLIQPGCLVTFGPFDLQLFKEKMRAAARIAFHPVLFFNLLRF